MGVADNILINIHNNRRLISIGILIVSFIVIFLTLGSNMNLEGLLIPIIAAFVIGIVSYVVIGFFPKQRSWKDNPKKYEV